jgi:Matrixin
MRRRLRAGMLAAAIVVTGIVAVRAADAFTILGNKWGDPVFGTPGGTVTYSFAPASTDCGLLLSSEFCRTRALATVFPAAFESAIASAFAQWAAAADIDFARASDNGLPLAFLPTGAGKIRIAAMPFSGAIERALAVTFPFEPQGAIILYNTLYDWELALDGTADGAFGLGWIALHEIGHAIGLGHEDVVLAVINATYTEAFGAVLQPDDVAGARFIYGPRVAVPAASTLGLLVGALGLGALAARRRRARTSKVA